MKYNLINATNKDTDYIKKSKLYNIFTYADDLPKDEVMRINNYVDEHIPVEITDYKTIMCNKNKVGCLLVAKKDDGVILNEVYLEEEYRNKGIGTDAHHLRNHPREHDTEAVCEPYVRAAAQYRLRLPHAGRTS